MNLVKFLKHRALPLLVDYETALSASNLTPDQFQDRVKTGQIVVYECDGEQKYLRSSLFF